MNLTTPTSTPLLLVALALAGNVLPVRAQDSASFYRPLTLAPADAASPGGGDSGSEDEQAKAAELAKKLANPVAALISVPIQNNFDWGAGPNGDGFQYKLNIQPVIPITLSEDWNIISRTILPVVYQENIIGTSSRFLLTRPRNRRRSSSTPRLPTTGRTNSGPCPST